ncbi:hypothetical protein MSG28_008080 [Choristoneura fumiferana]|uniref:Uncharacterized protein n=1 Tax=Choristoneura fumiferana TaxID=7141 RepID=A0ACC0JA01_CHOFU|nr:hypothetical protein MSG28_008080 [Choristoneura fumiferana]
MAYLNNIPLADLTWNIPGCIDLVLGVQLFPYIYLGNRVDSGTCAPPAFLTAFGYVLMGDYPCKSDPSNANSFTAHVLNDLESSLNQFWELEEIPFKRHLSPEETKCENLYTTSVSRNEEELGNSRSVAHRRLLYLEKKFKQMPTLRDSYNKVISEYMHNGYLTEIPESELTDDGYYIPHHAVIRPEKVTSPVRVVLDASAKTHSVAMTSDIKQMPTRSETLLRSASIALRSLGLSYDYNIVGESKSRTLKASSNAAVNSFGEITSCLAPRCKGISSSIPIHCKTNTVNHYEYLTSYQHSLRRLDTAAGAADKRACGSPDGKRSPPPIDTYSITRTAGLSRYYLLRNPILMLHRYELVQLRRRRSTLGLYTMPERKSLLRLKYELDLQNIRVSSSSSSSQPIYVPLLGTGLLSEQEGLGHSSHAGPVRIGNFTRTIEKPWWPSESLFPRFVEPVTNVTVTVGRDALLACVVEDLRGYKATALPRCMANETRWTKYDPERGSPPLSLILLPNSQTNDLASTPQGPVVSTE